MKNSTENSSTEKLWFIQALRGIAIIGVFVYHLSIKFWYQHAILMQAFIYLPSFQRERYLIFFPIQKLLDVIKFDLGAFSVALFFLVSGFIIPFSINKLGAKRFILRRIVRIYPTYIIGFLLTFLAITIFIELRNISYNIDITHYFAQISLFRTFIGIQSLYGVSWTLEIEIIFYLMVALLYKINRLSDAKFIVGFFTVSTLLSIIVPSYYPNIANKSMSLLYIVGTLNFTLIFVIFMFIGFRFYQLYAKTWSWQKVIIFIQLLLLYFVMLILNGTLGPENTFVYLVSFIAGLIVFVNVFLIREKLQYNAIINFFAEISYSLYIIHSVISYLLMSILENMGVNSYLSLIFAISISIILAYSLNRLVEKPSIKIGKKI